MSDNLDPPNVIHRHTRSTVVEGKRMLITVALTVIAFVIALIFVFPEILGSRSWIVIFGLGMASLAAMVSIVYALYNLAVPREFVCELTQHELRCICPLTGIGESFQVKINEIDKIELCEEGDGHGWYIWDMSGNRYRLLENYGNPATKFIKHILKMNKNIKEIYT